MRNPVTKFCNTPSPLTLGAKGRIAQMENKIKAVSGLSGALRGPRLFGAYYIVIRQASPALRLPCPNPGLSQPQPGPSPKGLIFSIFFSYYSYQPFRIWYLNLKYKQFLHKIFYITNMNAWYPVQFCAGTPICALVCRGGTLYDRVDRLYRTLWTMRLSLSITRQEACQLLIQWHYLACQVIRFVSPLIALNCWF